MKIFFSYLLNPIIQKTMKYIIVNRIPNIKIEIYDVKLNRDKAKNPKPNVILVGTTNFNMFIQKYFISSFITNL